MAKQINYWILQTQRIDADGNQIATDWTTWAGDEKIGTHSSQQEAMDWIDDVEREGVKLHKTREQPVTSNEARRIIRQCGYTVSRGGYLNASDDCIDGWYLDKPGRTLDRRGPGYRTLAEAAQQAWNHPIGDAA